MEIRKWTCSSCRLLTLVMWIPFVFLSLACGENLQDSISKNVAGEDSSIALLVGQGFNSVNSGAKGHCVDIGGLETQTGQISGSFAEYRLLEITSESSLRENLNVSASGSMKFAVMGGGSARMNFVRSVNKTGSSRYVLVHARVGNQLELATSFRLKEKAATLLASDKEGFVRNCGNEFVYGRRTGGEFYAVFEYEFHSAQEEKRFNTAIEASGFGWKASGNINQELAKFNMSARVHVKMLRFGGIGPLPDIKDLQDYGSKFGTVVSAMTGSPVTLELITKNYDGVEPFDISGYASSLTRQNRMIKQLAEAIEGAYESRRSIIYVKRNSHVFEDFDESHLSKAEVNLSRFINIYEQAVVDCFENYVNGCSIPQESYPSAPVLPERKKGTTGLLEYCESLRWQTYKRGMVDFNKYLQWKKFGEVPIFRNENDVESGVVASASCLVYGYLFKE
ncbi:MAG: hypothetical protein HYW48_08360 [Deltaproteobacteria bacterium]|nr:hypothetical protein [Deltaproteobacteria bacterium]